jgi:hypothetical protein
MCGALGLTQRIPSSASLVSVLGVPIGENPRSCLGENISAASTQRLLFPAPVLSTSPSPATSKMPTPSPLPLHERLLRGEWTEPDEMAAVAGGGRHCRSASQSRAAGSRAGWPRWRTGGGRRRCRSTSQRRVAAARQWSPRCRCGAPL